jgi:hypothetical protein
MRSRLVSAISLEYLSGIPWVELEAAQWYIPPEAPVSGDPWSWKYRFSFRSFCRTFVIYDGKDLFEEDIDCTTLGLVIRSILLRGG